MTSLSFVVASSSRWGDYDGADYALFLLHGAHVGTRFANRACHPPRPTVVVLFPLPGHASAVRSFSGFTVATTTICPRGSSATRSDSLRPCGKSGRVPVIAKICTSPRACLARASRSRGGHREPAGRFILLDFRREISAVDFRHDGYAHVQTSTAHEARWISVLAARTAVIQTGRSKITNFAGMHRKTRSAQIASAGRSEPPRRFSRVETRNIPRWLPSSVDARCRARRDARIAESYNDRLIGRASNNWCVARRIPRPTNSASLRAAPASARLPQRQIARETVRRAFDCPCAVACVHMMRIRNTRSARARIVRKCEIGKSRVVRAVTPARPLELTAG